MASQHVVSESGEPHKPRMGSFKKGLVKGVQNHGNI